MKDVWPRRATIPSIVATNHELWHGLDCGSRCEARFLLLGTVVKVLVFRTLDLLLYNAKKLDS